MDVGFDETRDGEAARALDDLSRFRDCAEMARDGCYAPGRNRDVGTSVAGGVRDCDIPNEKINCASRVTISFITNLRGRPACCPLHKAASLPLIRPSSRINPPVASVRHGTS